MKFLTKPVPAYTLILSILCAGSILLYFLNYPVKVIEKIESKNNSSFQVIRKTNYKFIKPMMMADRIEEDPSYNELKSTLNGFLDAEKSNGSIQSASVYVREFDQGNWFAINPQEQFSPGSIMKIASLITYLKASERNPDLLNQRVLFKGHFSEMPQQKIVTRKLTSGKYYTIKELMETMIIDSDNDATALLNQLMNSEIYFDLLKSLDLSVPKMTETDYPLTTVQCSRMLRVIYNSTYLNPENSEYAMSLLTQSKFHDGLAKSLPENVAIAHKFGERFNPIEQQLHETAIIYSNDKPYILTVMTKGTDQEKLKLALNTISKDVFDFMASR